jgi:leucine dehydrogenase
MAVVFDNPHFADHEDVRHVVDRASGLRAIIAIHSTALGPALGGTRYLAYPDDEAALTDALRLSAGMTAKAAIAGVPFGGGKGVILADAGADRSAVLRAYASQVHRLEGRFITGEDVGVDEADADLIHRHTPYIAGVSRRAGGLGDPSPRTAVGVVAAMRAALCRLSGDPGLGGRRVVVSGVGKVGAALCRLLAEEGASLTIADVSAEAVERVVGDVPGPVEVVGPAEAHRVRCDVFAPCALGGLLGPRTIAELHCAAVVGSANNQLAGDECAGLLSARGVLYVPDYVANAGGLISVAGEWLGIGPDEIDRRIAGIEHTVHQVFELSDLLGTTPAAAASRLVADRLARAGHGGPHSAGGPADRPSGAAEVAGAPGAPEEVAVGASRSWDGQG